MRTRLFGCDVAPARGAVIFDGDDYLEFNVNELAAWVKDRSATDLLAWDAPLTGPPERGAGLLQPGDLTQRAIESFFSQQATGFRVPKGISVRGYGGCPHWTITRRLLGLPRLGPYCSPLDKLPLRGLFEQNDREHIVNGDRPCVVEVHPAVALWLWCRNDSDESPWIYKGKGAQFDQVLNRLLVCLPAAEAYCRPKSHDQLDALIAFMLADRWLNGNGVISLGNATTGSFLLPESNKLTEAFDKFTRSL